MWAGKAKGLATVLIPLPSFPSMSVFVSENRMFCITFVLGLPWFCKGVSGAPTESKGEVHEYRASGALPTSLPVLFFSVIMPNFAHYIASEDRISLLKPKFENNYLSSAV